MIKSEEISVVLRGAVDETVLMQSLINLKKFLPKAEIIISTWEGTVLPEKANGFYHKLILSKDPGAVHNDPENIRWNMLLRILKACEAGVEAAERKYVLSMRSDLLLLKPNFLRYFDKFNKRDEKYSLAKHKILVNSFVTPIYFKEGNVKHPTPFHISDWWHFGLKEDLKMYYDADKIDDFEEFSRYFETHKRSKDYHMFIVDHRVWKFSPEQYIGKCFANKKFKNLDFPDFLSYDNVDLDEALKFTIDNFIVLDSRQSGFKLMKEPYKFHANDLSNLADVQFDGLIRFPVYVRLYRKYFDKGLHFTIDMPKLKRNKFVKKIFSKDVEFKNGKKRLVITVLGVKFKIRKNNG